MTTFGRMRQLELEGAERRLGELLRAPDSGQSAARRVGVLLVALALFAIAFAARLVISDPNALLANFYVVPIALLAIEFGTRSGLLAAAGAFALVPIWSVIEAVHVTPLGYVSRGAVFVVTGAVVGRFSERLRQDIAERKRVQRDLSVYADELKRANQHLSRSVEQLEAFAEIARAVGGETDQMRVLSLILDHGREIVAARKLVVFLPDGEELAAVSGSARSGEPELRLPLRDSLAGQVLVSGLPRRVAAGEQAAQLEQLMPGARAAILVPLIFRGEALGVLAAINGAEELMFEDEHEQLLMSVAASAATAVATARSVAAARLRLSLEAAEDARGRWARELHDETLQGLTGARMVLSAGLARGDPDSLRDAAEAADTHLGEEVRSLRELIAELRPAALDDLGLGPAIDSLAKRQAAAGGFTLAVELELGSAERLGRDTESAIYRIVQEALSNVVKHALASRVRLAVSLIADRAEIAVEDDGSGFDPAQVPEGFGLTGMRERALWEGGRLSVTSADGGPTCVSAVLPVGLRSAGNGAGRNVVLR
jgi:signal transduction histidine kinase